MSLQALSNCACLKGVHVCLSDQQLCAISDCKTEILCAHDRLAYASQKLYIQHRAPGGGGFVLARSVCDLDCMCRSLGGWCKQ